MMHSVCVTGGANLNQSILRRGSGMLRRIKWYLLAFLKEFKEETAKLLIRAISEA